MMRIRATLLGLVMSLAATGRAETLAFDSAAHESLNSILVASAQPVTIEGKLSLPAVAHKVPAVILLHTCIGPYTFDEVVARHLRSEGFATFEFDSLRPRGWSPADSCGGRIPAGPWAQMGDAYAALKALVQHPAIDASRIAVVGGSMGGGTAFLATSEQIRNKLAPGARFAAHASFYPGGSNMVHGKGALTGAPILLLLGERDDWTPAKRVLATVDFLKKADPATPITVRTYDAAHSWIGTAARSYQQSRKSFADCPYVMMQIDEEPVRNSLLSVGGDLMPISGKDIGAVYRQCRTSGATTEGSSTATEKSLADLTQFLKEVFSR